MPNRKTAHRRAMGIRSIRIVALAFGLIVIGLSQSGTAIAANGSVAYTYDALGRVTTVTYDTGVIVIYTYDANGNRTQQVINVNTTGLNWGTSTACTNTCWGNSNWQ